MGVAHCSLSWCAVTSRAVAPGEALAVVPASCALVADSRAALLQQLLVPANTLLQELVRVIAGRKCGPGGCGGGDSGGACGVGQLSRRELLVLHLLHTVSAPPAVRLPGSESTSVSMLTEMLEDSPVSSACQS
eukprot:305775-Chlamydomonas_euryale.AAC.1